ncbi:hypothetical protein ACIRU3_28120 [Streptomyces sp. NPDC101151]|uniref:hypothetical protein n=1 Tax=Streptomyces sp. NPDC101151 TaxID=3366115 RepID=UPI003817910B
MTTLSPWRRRRTPSWWSACGPVDGDAGRLLGRRHGALRAAKWFGRNTEAWRDTIRTRGISEVVDSYDMLGVHVDKPAVFAARNREARALRSAFAGPQSRLVVHVRDGDPASSHGRRESDDRA